MNREQLRKSVGFRIQLEPIACVLDKYGQELPTENHEWIVHQVTSAGVSISNVQTRHATTLGLDHIHHFTSNPDKSVQGGLQYGFFILNVQLFLQGNSLWLRPNSRPGERVKPPPVEILEKWVDFRYPSDSGLQSMLNAAGYRVAWCLDTRLARKIDLEGWEIVVEPDDRGMLTKFRLQDRPADQTLIKKRNG